MGRFMRKGQTKVFFLDTLAIVNAATPTEIGAGTELTEQLAEMNGFTFSNSPIQTPDMDTTFTSQIGGEDTAADSSMGFYELDDSATLQDDLAKNTDGYVIIFPIGFAGGSVADDDTYEAWPVTITSNARTYTVNNEAAMYSVSFSITDPPVAGTVTT